MKESSSPGHKYGNMKVCLTGDIVLCHGVSLQPVLPSDIKGFT